MKKLNDTVTKLAKQYKKTTTTREANAAGMQEMVSRTVDPDPAIVEVLAELAEGRESRRAEFAAREKDSRADSGLDTEEAERRIFARKEAELVDAALAEVTPNMKFNGRINPVHMLANWFATRALAHVQEMFFNNSGHYHWLASRYGERTAEEMAEAAFGAVLREVRGKVAKARWIEHGRTKEQAKAANQLDTLLLDNDEARSLVKMMVEQAKKTVWTDDREDLPEKRRRQFKRTKQAVAKAEAAYEDPRDVLPAKTQPVNAPKSLMSYDDFLLEDAAGPVSLDWTREQAAEDQAQDITAEESTEEGLVIALARLHELCTEGLTDRQRTIWTLTETGEKKMKRADVAAELGLSIKTVGNELAIAREMVEANNQRIKNEMLGELLDLCRTQSF